MSYSDPEGYERFMGCWSARLAPLFLRFAGIEDGQHVLDVGCGTGVLARTAVAGGRRIKVTGVDPVDTFIAYARAANDRRAEFRVGSVEALPFADGAFDAALGLLVLQEFDAPDRAIGEMARGTRRCGKVAACKWDFAGGMPMMAIFWDLARTLAPDEAARYEVNTRPLRNAGLDELTQRWERAGLSDVRAAPLEFRMPFRSFEEFWRPFTCGRPRHRPDATAHPAVALQLVAAQHRAELAGLACCKGSAPKPVRRCEPLADDRPARRHRAGDAELLRRRLTRRMSVATAPPAP